jgi:hypothetical protein
MKVCTPMAGSADSVDEAIKAAREAGEKVVMVFTLPWSKTIFWDGRLFADKAKYQKNLVSGVPTFVDHGLFNGDILFTGHVN